jgi:hypothetical protein
MPTTPKVHAIEVFEWRTGAPRPGTVGKARHDCLDILEPPPEGQAPQVGDVIALPDLTGRELLHYRVVGRELSWIHTRGKNGPVPARYGKMMLHVRRLADEEYREVP